MGKIYFVRLDSRRENGIYKPNLISSGVPQTLLHIYLERMYTDVYDIGLKTHNYIIIRLFGLPLTCDP